MIERSNVDEFSKFLILAANKFPKFSFETLFRFVRWIVCPQSSFKRKVREKKVHRFWPKSFSRIFFSMSILADFKLIFFSKNRHGHAKFPGVFGGVIKIYVLHLVLYLCSQKGKKMTSIFTKKKATPRFLESWHLMNINPKSMILKHEIDPVYKIFFFFLRVVSSLPHFLSGIR